MDFSLGTIIATVTAVLALIAGAVKVFKDIAERIDQKRKERDAKALADRTESAEIRKLDTEAKTQLLTDYRQEIDRLKEKIDEYENDDTLSRPKILRLREAARNLGRQIDICELLLLRGESRENVIAEFDILKQKFVETENLLP